MTGAAAAYEHLTAIEPRFMRLQGIYGDPDPFEWFDGGRTGTSKFAAMVLHIVSQRISALASFTVYDRIATATGGVPNPGSLLTLGERQLRATGLSHAKASCILDLARRQAAGEIELEDMEQLRDEQVIDALTETRGVGVWSAQAFLLRQLHRPDVIPAADMALRRAICTLWELARPPTLGAVQALARPWAPYRSYAAALLWRSLAPPGTPYDPKQRALLVLSNRTAR